LLFLAAGSRVLANDKDKTHPGAGKTTTAVFIAEWLEKQGVETAVYLEGNLDHPADFDSVACLDAQEYVNLKAQFPDYKDFLERQVLIDGDDHFSFIAPCSKPFPPFRKH
jgi:hypothetical protein